MEVLETKTALETQKLGLELAESLRTVSGKFTPLLRSMVAKEDFHDRALVIALNGELGSGKTTFIKGFAVGLGVKETITSPTYVFVRSYTFEPIRRPNFYKDTLYHIDLYRLEPWDKKAFDSFGFKEVLSDLRGIVLIEWAERIKEFGLKANFKINFGYTGGGRTRSLVFDRG